MKKMILMLAVVVVSASTFKSTAQINVNINLGSQPAWGPAGYDYVEYYYLPDIGAYYYVPTRQFIYLNNGNWIYANSLPSRYRSYNLYSGYKVVINDPKPYLRHSTYQVRYAKYKGVKGNQGNNKSNNKYKTYKSRGNGKGRN
jgi:hypothetical protein